MVKKVANINAIRAQKVLVLRQGKSARNRYSFDYLFM
jgi:hypothetical protein